MNTTHAEDQRAIELALSQDKLTTEWMTQALRHTGVIAVTNSVTAICVSTISGGMMASSYLVTLAYENEEPSAPASLVAKVPAVHADSKAAGKEIRAYEREVNFYKLLSPRIRMRTPQCYFAAIDPDSAEFALLLEDLNPATICKPKECTLEKLASSIKELALLHADTWNDTRLKGLHWIPDFSDPSYMQRTKAYAAQGWEVLKRAADDRVPEGFIEVGDTLLEHLDQWPKLMQERFCLTHCDYRMTNVMYGENNESIAIDWQTLHLARPGTDTFYLIANTLDHDVRRENEIPLLKIYYDALTAAGVKDYAWEDCLADYRFGSIYAVLMILMTTQGIGANHLPETYKKQIFFTVKRYWPFVREHQILDVLSTTA